MPVSSCWVIMCNFWLDFLNLLDFFRERFLALFFLGLNFLSYHIFLQSISRICKSLWNFFQVFFIFEMVVADELFFWQLYNFLLIHASGMKCFRATSALKDRHCVSTYATDITVMQRTSKMQRIGIDVLEQFFSIIFFNTFRMEVFSTVGSGALGYLVFPFEILVCSLLALLSLFFLSFLVLFVFGSIV